MNFGTLVDCSQAICFLCKKYRATWFEEREVTPKELVDLIKEFQYVIK